MSFLDRVIFKTLKMERSYSQSGEDKILFHLFSSVGKKNISYLDVGANHPQIHNNTYLFYLKGSCGVCVEPNPAFAGLIRSARPRDVCLNVGISTGGDDLADFYLMSSHTLSTFSKEEAVELDKAGVTSIEKTLKIPVRDINKIIEENFDAPIDLVSIDAEGWSEEIVKSIDFDRFRPFSFCVETLTFSENGDGQRLEGIFAVFEKNRYTVYADTHINTIFVDDLKGEGLGRR